MVKYGLREVDAGCAFRRTKLPSRASRSLVLRIEAGICVIAPEAAGRLIAQTELPPRAVKPISRSQWNGGFAADSGPSQGDRWRRATRPIEAPKATGCYVRNTSIRDVAQTSQVRKWRSFRASVLGCKII
jgi:hypothetical protein